ncbi:unnamed protein product [Ectocarpus sp. 12 AP-2014]
MNNHGKTATSCRKCPVRKGVFEVYMRVVHSTSKSKYRRSMPIRLKRGNAFSSLDFDNLTEGRRMHAYVGSRFTVRRFQRCSSTANQLRVVSSVLSSLYRILALAEHCFANIELRE